MKNIIFVLSFLFSFFASAQRYPGNNDAHFIWGRAISSTAPSNNQCLVWISVDNSWEPGSCAAGTGTVTSVALALPSIFTVSGSPVTTSGTLTGTLNTQSANTVFSGPTSGAAATPTFRALVSADLPAGTGTVTSVATGTGLTGGPITTTGTLSLANTAVTAGSYGTSSNVGTFTVDAQGRLTAASNTPISFDAISPLTTKGDLLGFSTVNARIPVGTNAQVLTADSTQTLGVKWATPTTGTVTSVALTVPAFLSVSGSPITSSGTLAVTLSGTALPILNGGTGATTASGALSNLGGANTALSNLASVAINQSLDGNADATFSLGATNRWNLIQGVKVNAGGATNGIFLQSLTAGSTWPSTMNGNSLSSGDANGMSIQTLNNSTADATATTPIALFTGNKTAGTGNSGNISFTTGTSAGGSRGSVVFKDGSEGTTGNFWVSTNTTGSGHWAAISSAALPTITLTGNVTGSGSGGSVATTIASNVVTNSMLAQMASNTIKGNNTGGTANAADLTVSQVNTMLGDVTTMGAFGSTPNANGASISGNTLTLQPASASQPGGVSTGAQSFAGTKQFAAQLNIGTPSITDTGVQMQTTANTNSYSQILNQNTNSGAAASTDFVVNNDSGTASTFYGDFGINSSGFTGSGSLNIPSAVYLYSMSGDLVLATNTSNTMHFLTNAATTDNMSIGPTGVVTIGQSGGTVAHQINGGLNFTTKTVTATTYTVDASESDVIIYTDSTSNVIAITLPAPTNGRIVYVYDLTGKAATNNVTIKQHASETINGLTQLVLTKNYSGTKLISNGTNWVSDVVPDSGFTLVTGGITYTTPVNTNPQTRFKFTLIGGGGGGAGAATNGLNGAGGGAGANCMIVLTGLSANTAYTTAIGAAGTAGTSAPTGGGSGGNTTIAINATTYTAAGGSGGAAGASTAGGAGGACTNTTINMTGQAGGGSSTAALKFGGAPGGSNQHGQGGASGLSGVNATGTTATGFGGGGGGAGDTNAAEAGGAGTAGAILVEWNN